MNCIYLKKITIESTVNGKERKKVNRTRDERDERDEDVEGERIMLLRNIQVQVLQYL